MPEFSWQIEEERIKRFRDVDTLEWMYYKVCEACKKPKDYVPQNSLEDIPITKIIRDRRQENTGERGSSNTKMFSNDESTTNGDRLGPQMIGPQNNRGQVCNT